MQDKIAFEENWSKPNDLKCILDAIKFEEVSFAIDRVTPEQMCRPGTFLLSK